MALLTAGFFSLAALAGAPAPPGEAPVPLCALAELDDAQREEAIRAVYERLVRAVGDRRIQPVLTVSHDPPSTPAVIEPEAGIIRVESHLYDVCAGTGGVEDCLAFVLGHELVHFTQQHRSGALAGAAADRHLRVEQEARADYHGVFYAHLAGYDARTAAKPALEAVYACYGLNDRIRGYLDRTRRLGVLDDAVQQAREWLAVFDVANHLGRIRRYDLAYPLFDHIGREFPSREILNNAAASRIGFLQAHALRDDRAYPIQLDLDSRLSDRAASAQGGRRQSRVAAPWNEDARPGPGERWRRALLDEAIRQLRELHYREGSDYTPAMLNLASAWMISGEPEQAEPLLDRLRGMGGPLARDVGVLRALLLAATGRSAQAIAALAEIEGDAARWNEHLLKHGWPPPGELSLAPPFSRVEERIEREFPGLLPRAEAEATVQERIVGLFGPGELADVRIAHRRSPDSTLMALYVAADLRALFVGTGPESEAATWEGLRVGDARARVEELHGARHRTLSLDSGGEYLVYDREGLMVLVEAGVVAGWIYYWSRE